MSTIMFSKKSAIKQPMIPILDMGLVFVLQRSMWYLGSFQNCGFTSNMVMLMRKWWSQIQFRCAPPPPAPYFQASRLIQGPWICSPEFSGYQLFYLWGILSQNKSSLSLSCFHPQRHSTSSSSPAILVVSCCDGRRKKMWLQNQAS